MHQSGLNGKQEQGMIEMRSLNIYAGAVLFGCVSMGTAHADGMPRAGGYYAPPPSFAGFYLGGHVGYVFDGPRATLFDDGIGAAEAITSPSYRSPSYGLQGGYNFQSRGFLVGVEVDWSWAGDSRQTSTNEAGDNDIVRARLNDYGSVRGRAGVVWDRVLLFGTLGWGWANANYRLVDSDEGTLRVHRTDSGVVFGGGVEVLLDRHITLRGEYLRYDFGDSHFISAPVAFHGNSDASVKIEDINEVRLSLNFKFGDDRRVAPLK